MSGKSHICENNSQIIISELFTEKLFSYLYEMAIGFPSETLGVTSWTPLNVDYSELSFSSLTKHHTTPHQVQQKINRESSRST